MTILLSKFAHFKTDALAVPAAASVGRHLCPPKFGDKARVGCQGTRSSSSFLVSRFRPCISASLREASKLLLSPSRICPEGLHSLRLALTFNWCHFVSVCAAVAVLMAVSANVDRSVLHSSATTAWLQMMSMEMLSEHPAIMASSIHGVLRNGYYSVSDDHLPRVRS